MKKQIGRPCKTKQAPKTGRETSHAHRDLHKACGRKSYCKRQIGEARFNASPVSIVTSSSGQSHPKRLDCRVLVNDRRPGSRGCLYEIGMAWCRRRDQDRIDIWGLDDVGNLGARAVVGRPTSPRCTNKCGRAETCFSPAA